MKLYSTLLVCIGLILSTSALVGWDRPDRGAGYGTAGWDHEYPGLGQAQPSFYSDWQSSKIDQTSTPIFPPTLQQLGVTEGVAQVIINISPDGKLVDWLVVGYTHKEFATSAVAELQTWKYEPALWHGDRVGTVMELIFHFEARGTVVTSQNISEILESHLMRLMEQSYVFKVYSLKELDRIPAPLVTIKPLYPPELSDKGIKGKVTVDFFIDETGTVRVPAVSINDDARLCALAVDAIRQWKFEPPLKNGKPVLVKAVQEFDFHPTP